jgi:pimeloyl-ACP methyl ester carboxylesterase
MVAGMSTSGLHVETAGAGEPVVLLHSSGFSGRQWKRLAGELVTRGYRAVVPDLTGHGQSEAWPEPRPFTFRVDVERVAAIVRETGGAHVVAHSYGGLVALHAALAEPAAVRSLALFDPVAFAVLDPVADDDARRVLSGLDLAWDDPERWLRTFVDFWGGDGAWAGLREPVRVEFRRIGWVVSQGVASLMTDPTPLATYRALAMPVRLMTGELSPVPAQRVDRHLAGALANGRLDVIAGAGHLAPVTDPAEVNRRVLEMIAGA